MKQDNTNFYDIREVKEFIRGKKRSKEYKQKKIDPCLDALNRTFRGGIEYEEVEKYIIDTYSSGDKSNEYHNTLKKKHLEEYYQRQYKLTRKYTGGDYQKPPGIYFLEAHAVPRLYVSFNYTNEGEYLIEVNTPPLFTYSGKIDSYRNLLRKSGYLDETPYHNLELLTETRYIGPTCIPADWDELEKLRYVYRCLPYTILWGGTAWLATTMELSRGGKYVKEFRELGPGLILRNADARQIWDNSIPFEIEGMLVWTSVENLYRVIKLYRGDIPYNIGQCDDMRKVILHLAFVHSGKEEDRVTEFLQPKTYKEITNFLESIESIVVEKTKESIVPEELKAAYYYASESERLSETFTDLIPDEIRKTIELASRLGTREIFYRAKLSGIEHLGAEKDLETFFQEEDKLLERANKKYGLHISREEIYDPFGGGCELDEEFDFDSFANLDVTEDNTEEFTPLVEDMTQTRRTYQVSNESWQQYRTGATASARMIWDPGGGVRYEQGSSAEPAIINHGPGGDSWY